MVTYYTYQQLENKLKSNLNRVRFMDQIPDDLFTLKPEPTKWSVAEICKHISKFNSLYIAQIEKSLQNDRLPKTDSDRFYARFIYRQFIRFLEPPYKVKMGTIAPLYPAVNDIQKDEILNSLLDTQDQLISLINLANSKSLDLNAIKGRNPVANWLSMSISDFLLVQDAHQRRHVWQSEQTLKKLSGSSYEPG